MNKHEEFIKHLKENHPCVEEVRLFEDGYIVYFILGGRKYFGHTMFGGSNILKVQCDIEEYCVMCEQRLTQIMGRIL